MESSSEAIKPKRELGLFSAVCFIIGTMIGSGIFVSSSSALLYSGSVAMCIIVWSSCGILCFFGALVYAELGTVVPKSGAEYVFYMESFGKLHKFWGPLPGFLYCFVVVLLVRPVEVAVIILASAEYIVELIKNFLCLENEDQYENAKTLIALLEITIMTYINATSVKLYVSVQNLFTFLKVCACLIVIGGGAYVMCKGEFQNLESGFEGTNWAPKNISLAFYSGLWAYDGWTCVSNITEEVKKPEKNVLRSIAIGIPFITIFYVLMNISYMTVLTIPEITNSTAVAMTFGNKLLTPFEAVMPLGVAISAFGCAMAYQFGISRLCYASAQEGHIPQSMSFLHVSRLVPSPAVLLQGLVSLVVIAIGGEIIELIEFVSFLLWLSYGFAMVAFLVLRKVKKDAPRPFKAPAWMAVVVMLVSAFLCVAPVATDPSVKYLIAIGFVVVAFIVYYFVVYKQYQPNMDKFTYFVQVLLTVVPPSDGNEEIVNEQPKNKLS